MTEVNIKEEVKELEAIGKEKYEQLTTEEERERFRPYETIVTPIFNDKEITHKHIKIPELGKEYSRTPDNKWYLLENNCIYCK